MGVTVTVQVIRWFPQEEGCLVDPLEREICPACQHCCESYQVCNWYCNCKLLRYVSAHLWSLDEAMCGTEWVSPIMCWSGLWFDCMVKFLPNRIWCNFLTPRVIDKPSLSNWEYLHSAGGRYLEVKARGFSSLYGVICDKTAPMPCRDASQSSRSSL